MPLSRLENFLKNAEGNILYVNPSDFDATDSIENRGNSLTRPFKTIQRALIEAARFSYQTGKNNDKIDRTTILTFPGTHYIDNRPGYTVIDNNGSAQFKARRNSNYVEVTLNEFTTETNFDVLDRNNDLYKYNSTEGGVILPRGTSIIGLDLRKTKIRPLYVPDPEDDRFEYTSVFRVTGTCYFTAFSLFDADLSKVAYYDFNSNSKKPTFSHHKLSCFQYADGVNNVIIDGSDSGLTDLDMFYYKVVEHMVMLLVVQLVTFPRLTILNQILMNLGLLVTLLLIQLVLVLLRQETVTPPPHKLQSLLTKHTTSSKRHQFLLLVSLHLLTPTMVPLWLRKF